MGGSHIRRHFKVQMRCYCTTEHVWGDGWYPHNLTKGIEFELRNTVVVCGITLQPLWSIPTRMGNGLSVI